MEMNDFKRKNILQELSSRYELKDKKLCVLKDEISNIQLEMFREFRNDQPVAHQSVEKAVVWMGRLHSVRTQLKSVTIDDSREHRYLQHIEKQVELLMMEPSAQDQELTDMMTAITDLNLVHTKLCGDKDDIENSTNCAYRTLAKAQMHLSEEALVDGADLDGITHFVKQHVSRRRQKQPFQDLTNSSLSINTYPSHRHVADGKPHPNIRMEPNANQTFSSKFLAAQDGSAGFTANGKENMNDRSVRCVQSCQQPPTGGRLKLSHFSTVYVSPCHHTSVCSIQQPMDPDPESAVQIPTTSYCTMEHTHVTNSPSDTEAAMDIPYIDDEI